MKVSLENALALFTALTFTTAHKWDAERFNKKFREIGVVFDDPDNYDPDSITDKKIRKLYDDVKAAYEADEEIVIDEESKPAKKKKGKKAVSAESDEGGVAVETDEAEEAAPDAETPDDGDEDASEEKNPAKSEKSAPADEAEEGLAVEDDGEEEEVPVPSKKKSMKKKTKPAAKVEEKPAKKKPRAESSVERDWMGCKVGSDCALINACFSDSVMTAADIHAKTKVRTKTVYHQAWVLFHKGLIEKKDGGYVLTKTGIKAKKGKA